MFDEKTTSSPHVIPYITCTNAFSVLWYVICILFLYPPLSSLFPISFSYQSHLENRGNFLDFFVYFIQHCFICRPSDSTCVTSLTSVSFTVFSFSICSHFFSSSFSVFLISLSLIFLLIFRSSSCPS
jgi:hypothetical protein